MVHFIKKHYYTVLLILFSVGMVITKAPELYLSDTSTGAFWIFGWCASAFLVGLHESKSVLLDYTHNKKQVPIMMTLLNIGVWGLFIIGLFVEFSK